jgi:hypothetical protein
MTMFWLVAFLFTTIFAVGAWLIERSEASSWRAEWEGQLRERYRLEDALRELKERMRTLLD